MNELKSEPDAEGLAFELNDLLVGAYWARLAGFPTPLGPGLAECILQQGEGSRARRPTDAQNESFRANCRIRGSYADVMAPTLLEVSREFGSLKFTLLNT